MSSRESDDHFRFGYDDHFLLGRTCSRKNVRASAQDFKFVISHNSLDPRLKCQ